MSYIDKLKSNKTILILGFFIFIAVTYLVKLDYHYVFTDEILYINSGREHLEGIYTMTPQVPLPTKYLAGILYHLTNRNIYLMRIPFALMGVLTGIVIYKILKEEFDYKWGLIGGILFATSWTIYIASRMIMLEPLMHLSWTLFGYFFYKAINLHKLKFYILSGIFFGLSLASKVTSLILVPLIGFFFIYSIIKNKNIIKKITVNYTILGVIGVGLLLVTYTDLMLKMGEINGLKSVYDSIFDVYINKSNEGKKHIINNEIYLISPWWTYIYYLYVNDGIIRILLYVFGLSSAIILALRKNLFVVFWGLFFLLSFSFHQLSGVKNLRYVSSFEIPLIILVVAGLNYLYNKLKHKKIASVILLSFVITFLVTFSIRVIMFQPTEYNALFNYLETKTNNFETDDKVYIFGSTRSARWYKHGKAEGRDMFNISKSLDTFCNDFYIYKYIIFDKSDLFREAENNLLYEFVIVNKESFIIKDDYGFLIYERKDNSEVINVCRN